ncbi:hypothetical protein PTKIN_Ptkin10aG0040100 [Pterospermum kingtungense]
MLVNKWASLMGCQADKLPTVYLGLPLVARANAISVWNLIIENFMKDKLIWKGIVFGKYSSRLFCNEHLNVVSHHHSQWNKVWNGLVPPKVETFCWQMLRGRIAVKKNLAARSVLQNSDISCPFVAMRKSPLITCFSHVISTGVSGLIGVAFEASRGLSMRMDGLVFRLGILFFP